MEVKIEDLPETSNAIVDTVCDFCGEPHKMTYCKYIGAKDSGICCYKCRHKKSKKTNIEKYGVENTSQLEENKENEKKLVWKDMVILVIYAQTIPKEK